MPHVIIEYSNDLLSEADARILLNSVHHTVGETGLFDVNNIKTRLIPVSVYHIADGSKKFMHVQLRIHEGRTGEQKKSLTHKVLDSITQQKFNDCIITAEVVEMDGASYAKELVE